MAFWTFDQSANSREWADWDEGSWDFLLSESNQVSTLGAIGQDTSRWYSLDQLPPSIGRFKYLTKTKPPIITATWPRYQPLEYLRAAFFFGCLTANHSMVGHDLPSQAVKQGAKSAFGFTSLVDMTQEWRFVKSFSVCIDKGWTIDESAQYAASYIGGMQNVQINGGANTILKPATWGDTIGPERGLP